MSLETRALLYLVAAAAFIVGLKRLGSPHAAATPSPRRECCSPWW